MIKAYIDFQNVFQNLPEKTGFNFLHLNIHDLIDELLEGVGETATPMHRGYAGIPSKKADEISRSRQIRIFDALRHRQGLDVFTRSLAYRHLNDGSVVSREKGIDVRLSCELVADVAYGQTTGALIWSWDQDLSEAAKVAQQLAASQGREFRIYSIELDCDDGNATATGRLKPIYETIPIKLTRIMLHRHLRYTDDGDQAETAPEELVIAAAQQASISLHA